jgi:hypothetical protein
VLGLPINFFMIPAVQGAKAAVANAVKPHVPIDRAMILLAFTFAAAWTVTGAMAAHFRASWKPPARRPAGDCGRRGSGLRRSLRGSSNRLSAAFIRWFRRGSLPSPIRSAPSSSPSWRRGGERVRCLSMVRQRHSHHRARHAAASIFGSQNYAYRPACSVRPRAWHGRPLAFGPDRRMGSKSDRVPPH